MIDTGQLTALILLPLIRAAVQWANNALDDGKIENFELQKGIATIIRVSFLGLVAYYGLNSVLEGVDIDLITTALGATLFDYLYSLVKKLQKPAPVP